MGAFGMQVPEEFSGIGLNNSAYARMVEIVGKHDLGVGIYLGAHQSIGFKGILLDGNDAQKEKYLPRLATGEWLAAFALTEPGSGSDAASIKTRATLSEDGSHYVLNGSKIWISNGGMCQLYTVFAQTEVTDPVTGAKKDKITAFIVERDFGGITSGPPEKKLGIKCSNTAEVSFDGTKVPVENVLGEVGGGFKVAMSILNSGRFGMGAALSGTMKFLVAGAAEHATQRVQFGRTLKEFEAVKGKVADMALRLYATEAMAYLVAGQMDLDSQDYLLEAAVGKIFASENAWHVADETIQLLGGLGYMEEYPYARILRDLRIFRIFEGSNDILRLFIALTGLQSLGAELKPLQAAMKNPLGNLGTLLPAVVEMGKARAGMPSKPELAWAAPALRPGAQAVEGATAAFGAACKELLMKHGKGIIEQQLHLSRVADCIIDLSTATAALSRATKAVNEGSATAEHEVALANAWAAQATRRVHENVGAFSGARAVEDKAVHAIAEAVFAAGGPATTHPLGI